MKFITTITVDGQQFAGPQIEAETWDQARAKLTAATSEVTGALDSTQEPV